MTHDEEMIQRGQDAIDGSALSDDTLALMEAVRVLDEARVQLLWNSPMPVYAYVFHALQHVEELLKQRLFAEDSAETRKA